jgi:anti-sigma factor RsiW
MIPVDRPVDEGDLHARIDGLLPPHRGAAVDEYLAVNPDALARFSQYAEQREALRAAFAAQVGPTPDRLSVARIREERRHRCYRHWHELPQP